MGDRSSAGWDCCHNPGQGEGLDNVYLTSKGRMKPASQGLWAVQACPSFLGNNIENKQSIYAKYLKKNHIRNVLILFKGGGADPKSENCIRKSQSQLRGGGVGAKYENHIRNVLMSWGEGVRKIQPKS